MITLNRFSSGPMGTFGVLRWGQNEAFTVEREWKNNEPFVSCVPTGEYKLVWHVSPKFGRTLALIGRGVTLEPEGERWGILFHRANVARQLQGCIAIGNRLGWIYEHWAVAKSKDTLESFIADMERWPDHKLRLRIEHEAIDYSPK